MSSSLIIVGESIIYNPPFMDYMMRSLKKHISFFNSIKLLDKNDSNFFIELEEMISKYEQTIVVAQDESFSFVNKIFSTLNDDNLVLKDDMLIPSKTLIYEKYSYIIKKNNHAINVIRANENETLPQVLINTAFTSRTFTIVDIDMDSINVLLGPLCETYEIKTNATAIISGWTCVNAKAYKYGNLENFLKAVKSLFAHKYIETDNVIKHIVVSLEKNEKKITAVESCTGGLISSMLTEQAGVSTVFDGGLVTYANKVKESWLGVSPQTLQKYGAVSEACVQEMLDGALQASRADYALATSGIAGPSGGSAQKPVGTVFVGAKAADGTIQIERLLLQGDRIYIQKQSAYHAFKLLLQLGKTLF